MHPDTPPPDDDALSDDGPSNFDDIEIIEEYEVEEEIEVPEDFEKARLNYASHSEPVFCCALLEGNQLAASGSQDEKAHLWNIMSGETVLECTGFKDSVFAVDFSHDSKYLAAADMSGLVKVWNLRDYSLAWSFDLMEDLKLMEWHHSSNVLFAGASDGSCWLWRVPSGEAKTFPCCNVPCTCGGLMPDGLRAFVGYEDGSVRILDLKSTSVIHTITGQLAHKGPVTSIDCHSENNLVISGSADGTAKLIKTVDGKVLCTLRCEPEDLDHKSVESVAFFTSLPLIASATVCGSLAIWDIPTQVRRLQCEQESGITKLICETAAPMVYTAGIDGAVRLIDGRTGQLERVWGGHTAAILDFELSSDRRTIVTTSDDCTCKVFDICR